MKRILLALLAGGTMAGAVAGAAATLNVDGGTLQAGADNDLTCTAGVAIENYAVESNNLGVYFAKLSGLEDCQDTGEWVIIKFNNQNSLMAVVPLDASAASSTVTLGQGQQTAKLDNDGLLRVNFPAGTAASAINDLRVVVHSG